MEYMLDTHALLWYMNGEPNLSENVLSVIENRNNEINVSAISFWEIAIKSSIGKLSLDKNDLEKIRSQCLCSEFNILNVESNDAISYLELPFKKNHRDPFDRMIVATAIKNNYTLLSCDNKFEQYKEDGLSVLW